MPSKGPSSFGINFGIPHVVGGGCMHLDACILMPECTRRLPGIILIFLSQGLVHAFFYVVLQKTSVMVLPMLYEFFSYDPLRDIYALPLNMCDLV